MTDSLKFGPEWLRNLSQDGPSAGSGGGGPRYQLAEHRYGREEMLALFDKTLGQPEILGRFKSLYVDRLQPPLALAPSQDDESSLINRGGGWMSRPLTGGIGSSLRGGRGGGVSVDRGRGRGIRGNSYHSQNMVGGSGGSQLGNPYQRSQSGFDTEDIGIRINRPRPWGEQNGETEWNGTTSPRKEFNTGGRANMDNWRRQRATDDDDAWRIQPEQRRSEKWGRSGTSSSWRDGDTSGGQEGGPGGDREQLSRGIERLERELRERGGASDRGDRISHHSQSSGASAVARSWNARKPWDVDDILPEWAMENPSESGGSFDASGAFHGSDDEHEKSSRLNHSHSTNNIHSSPRHPTLSRSQTQGSILVNKHSNSSEPSNVKHRLKDQPTTETSHSDEETNYQNRKHEDTRQSSGTRQSKSEREINIEHLNADQKTVEINVQNNKAQDGNNKAESKRKNNKQDSEIQSKAKVDIAKEDSKADEDVDQEVARATDRNRSASKSSKESSVDNLSSNGSPCNKIDDVLKEEEVRKKIGTPQESPLQQHDEFARMQEVADDIVAQLMMDEERTPPTMSTAQQLLSQVLPPVSSLGPAGLPVNAVPLPPNLHGVLPMMQTSQPVLPVLGSDKWFYRDPQGEVQGPFLANEMSEWYRAGYFTNDLLVRRACDDRYTTLGELLKLCGGVVPFNTSVRLPPLKQVETSPLLNTNGLPTPQNAPGLIPGTPQYRQAQVLSRQIAARHDAQIQVLRELSRSERWGSMTPGEQNAVLMQHLAQIPFPDPYVTNTAPAGLGIAPPAMPLTQPTTVPQHNPLLQLISQMQQAKQTNNLMSQVNPMVDPTKPSGLSHINHNQLSGLAGTHSGLPIPGALNHLSNNPINHLTQAALHQQLSQTMSMNGPEGLIDQTKLQNNEDIRLMFKQLFSKVANKKPQVSEANAGSWNPSWGSASNVGSMWDVAVTKLEMKTEQQILEEQLRLRKEAEEKENREKEHKRQLEEAQQVLKIKEREKEKAKRKQEEEKAKKEAEEKEKAEQKLKQIAEQQKKLQQEQEQRLKKELEAKAKREAEEKRLRELEEKRRLKEERKEAELKRKQEAELMIKRKQEAELEKAKEEARQKQLEEEKEREKERQKAAAAEAKKLQQQQAAIISSNKAAPWTSSNASNNMSLAEIQRLEKEKRAEQLKEQQAQQLALRQQQALLKEQEIAAANERSAMQLKWANQKPQASTKVQSLAEIQAEEMAKQQAAERLSAQQRGRESPVMQQAPSIWSTSPTLNWSSTAWNANNCYWDEGSVAPTKNQAKSNGKQMSPQNKSANKNVHANHNGGPKVNAIVSKNAVANNNNNTSSKKKKKDEKDDFTNWCTKAMSSINSSVDAPTFIGFLNEIDSPFEVKDYIRTYLGDSKEALDFTKQFLEKRSRYRNQQRLASAHIDDMCSPAPAINPASENHEGKGKKSKKNKMQKVDSRILGFNVTAAQDRINIGDRDYGDAN